MHAVDAVIRIHGDGGQPRVHARYEPDDGQLVVSLADRNAGVHLEATPDQLASWLTDVAYGADQAAHGQVLLPLLADLLVGLHDWPQLTNQYKAAVTAVRAGIADLRTTTREGGNK